MKNLIFSTLILTFMAFGAVNVNAQETDEASATADVSANIQAVLEIAKTADVDFGTVSETRVGTGATNMFLDPTANNHRFLAANFVVGKFELSGGNDQSVIVNFGSSVTLDAADASGSVTYVPALTGSSADNQATSASLTDGGAVSLSTTGLYSIFVGGHLENLTGNQGAYAGTFTVTVNYE